MKCCARCRTPYNCGNKECACHGVKEVSWEEEWAKYEELNSTERNDLRFRLDKQAGQNDKRRDRYGT